MQIETRYFGEVEIDAAEVIHFVQPIYGFEALDDFALLSDSGVGDCFLWLQSTQERDVCFILVDPAVLDRPYSPTLPVELLAQLGGIAPRDAVVRLVAVIPDDFTASTVNLKCPIVINTVGRQATQAMLEEDYPIRAPLVAGGKGEPPC